MKTQERIGSSSAANPRGQVVRIPDHAQSPEGALFPPDNQGWRTPPPPPRRASGWTLGPRTGEILGAPPTLWPPRAPSPRAPRSPHGKGSPATPSPEPAHRGATPAEDPRALHHRGSPERLTSGPLLGGSSQEPLTECLHRRPLLGGSSTAAPSSEDAAPEPLTGSSPTLLLGGTYGRPTGDRRHSPSSEVPQRRMPWEGPPRPGFSEPRQETNPEQAHRRCHRGASPAETPRGLYHPWHPTERPIGSPPPRRKQLQAPRRVASPPPPPRREQHRRTLLGGCSAGAPHREFPQLLSPRRER
jgi:hypothetical protein